MLRFARKREEFVGGEGDAVVVSVGVAEHVERHLPKLELARGAHQPISLPEPERYRENPPPSHILSHVHSRVDSSPPVQARFERRALCIFFGRLEFRINSIGAMIENPALSQYSPELSQSAEVHVSDLPRTKSDPKNSPRPFFLLPKPFHHVRSKHRQQALAPSPPVSALDPPHPRSAIDSFSRSAVVSFTVASSMALLGGRLNNNVRDSLSYRVSIESLR